MERQFFEALLRLRGSRSDAMPFLKYCALNMEHSHSQLFQDLLVLFLLEEKRNGYFVEFGATNGIKLSNTFLLENKFDWHGIVAEPAHCWHSELSHNRTCLIDHRCVWSASGETLQFNETTAAEFSTVDALSGADLHAELRRAGTRYAVETISLRDLLRAYDSPINIDYLSIDTEGSEFPILESFFPSQYDIRVITVEHNYTENRYQIHDLLVSHGYKQVFKELSFFDGWYTKQEEPNLRLRSSSSGDRCVSIPDVAPLVDSSSVNACGGVQSPMASRIAIDEVYLINLERDKERLARFREVNRHLRRIHRPPAIEGRSLDRRHLQNVGEISHDLSYNHASLGNAHSHIELWRLAVEKRTSITIAEDDAVFARNFLTASKAFSGLLPADWDIVMWGWNFDAYLWVEMPEGVARCKMTFKQEDLRQNIEAFRGGSSHPTPVRLRHSFGIMAYTVSSVGGEKLLATCLPLHNVLIPFPGFDVVIENKSIDCMMNMAYPKMKAYVCMPPLAASENLHETSHTRRDL